MNSNGELHDFLPLDGGRLLFGIAESDSAEAPGAVLVARSFAVVRPGIGPTCSPDEVLEAVCRDLCPSQPNHLCITVFYGGLGADARMQGYNGMGHRLRRRNTGHVARCPSTHCAANVPAAPELSPLPVDFKLQPGDVVVLNVDDLVRSLGAGADESPDAHLISLLQARPPVSPEQAIQDLHPFLREPGTDDLTFLVIQHQPVHPLLPEETAWQWRVAIGSDLSRLSHVRQRLTKILEKKGVGMETIQDTQLIVEELLANTIRYGCTAASPCRIDMHFRVTPDHLEMCFEDNGLPFNPLAEIAPPDLDADDESRAMGGFGFFLVCELAERIDYVHRDGKNVLTVALALPPNT